MGNSSALLTYLYTDYKKVDRYFCFLWMPSKNNLFGKFELIALREMEQIICQSRQPRNSSAICLESDFSFMKAIYILMILLSFGIFSDIIWGHVARKTEVIRQVLSFSGTGRSQCHSKQTLHMEIPADGITCKQQLFKKSEQTKTDLFNLALQSNNKKK